MDKIFYKGFSTQKWLDTNGQTFTTINIECVQRDIISHIFTKPGDRVTNPNFGTRIPLMAFEQNDEITRGIIYDDIQMVVNYDPRIKLIDLSVTSNEDDYSITAYLNLFYVEFEVTSVLKIDIPVNS